MRLDNYTASTFTSLPRTALNENLFEQTVLLDYMRSNAVSFLDIANSVIADMAASRWTPRLCELYVDTRDISLTAFSHICAGCSVLLWNEMIYRYRDSITIRLPAHISGRAACWYGKDCKTQKHNQAHAQKLNHICAPDTTKTQRRH